MIYFIPITWPDLKAKAEPIGKFKRSNSDRQNNVNDSKDWNLSKNRLRRMELISKTFRQRCEKSKKRQMNLGKFG